MLQKVRCYINKNVMNIHFMNEDVIGDAPLLTQLQTTSLTHINALLLGNEVKLC